MRTIGELGIGTNPLARLTGVILEDEKIYGSTHIARVTLAPEVYLDGVLVAKGGRLVG